MTADAEGESRPLRTVVYHHDAWPRVVSVWSEIVRRTPSASFFLTTEWVECWMEVFGSKLRPEILVFEDNAVPVGACLLVSRWELRGPFPVRRVYLNTDGEGDYQSPCIEFNQLLCLEGFERRVADSLWRHLSGRHWDEVVATGFTDGPGLHALRAAFGGSEENIRWAPSHYVDLAPLRQSNTAYETTLSRKVRQQLRQNLTKYGERGELRVEVATDVVRAHAMLADLAVAHQKTWNVRGLPGSFSAPRFVEFHRRLIEKTFPLGAIQVLRVAAGAETVGIAYNFVRNGKAYFYQCGLHYSEDKRMKPGFVTQVFAIRHALATGLDEYDLMAGDAPYKRELAESFRRLAWVVFQRRGVKMRVIEMLRGARRRVRRLLGARA